MMRPLLLSLVLAGSVAAQDITQNLSVWLPFDEGGVNRISGFVYTAVSSPLTINDGARGSAARFSGANRYYELASTSLFGGVSELTVTCWVRMDSAEGSSGIIVRGPDTYLWQWNVTSAGTTAFFVRVGGSTYTGTVGDLRATGWRHVAGVFNRADPDAIRLRVYLDGELVGINDSIPNANIDSATGYLRFGRWNPEYYNGDLDDARIYTRALSAGEIAEIYHGGRQPIYGGE